jgi:hypothetical protein
MSTFPKVDAETTKRLNLVDRIMHYEAGDMDPEEITDLFQDLLDTGLAYSLQGSYGRKAAELLKAGHITRKGQTK